MIAEIPPLCTVKQTSLCPALHQKCILLTRSSSRCSLHTPRLRSYLGREGVCTSGAGWGIVSDSHHDITSSWFGLQRQICRAKIDRSSNKADDWLFAVKVITLVDEPPSQMSKNKEWIMRFYKSPNLLNQFNANIIDHCIKYGTRWNTLYNFLYFCVYVFRFDWSLGFF